MIYIVAILDNVAQVNEFMENLEEQDANIQDYSTWPYSENPGVNGQITGVYLDVALVVM